MALVSGRGSGLNPNARPYIPTVYRQVEDFSSEWWNLVQNSPWFRDYWMTERQEATVDKSDAKDDDITNLLPDTFDVEYDDFNNEEAEFQEFIGSSDYHGGRGLGAQVKPQNVDAVDATSLIKNINMNSMSAKGRGPTTNYLREQPKYHDRPGQHMSYNHGVRRIHQPR